ncbi:hypothetical protein HZC30_01015 [Candidatus Woesearchaeota archaeon]|nr:hypothetical protein [Candidatus Woesearchaeota archaeon]
MNFENKFLDKLSKKDLSILILLRELTGLYQNYAHQFQGIRDTTHPLFSLLSNSSVLINLLTEKAEYMKSKGFESIKFKELLENYLNHLLGVFNTINSFKKSFFERERKLSASSKKGNDFLTAMEKKINKIISLIKEEKAILTKELSARGWSPSYVQTATFKILDSIN